MSRSRLGSAAKTGGPPGTRPGLALAALAGAQFVVTLSTSVVNVALPAIRDGIGLTGSGLSWVVNSYGLAFGALLLLGGRAADLLGRRRVLLAGLALFAAASFGAGLATAPWTLLTARTLQGVGAAAVAPAALSLVMRLFPPGPRRGGALGVWGAVSGAGGAAGVLAGGVLTEGLGWSWVFHAAGLGAVVVLAATVALVPAVAPPSREARRPLDIAGALAVTAGLVALVHGLTTARSAGWGAPPVLGSLAVAAALLVLLVLIERRHREPLVPPRLFAQGPVAPANLVMALLGAVWVGLFFFLPLHQQQVLGAGPLEAGVSQLPLAVANMLGSWAAPRLARRLGPHLTLAAGLLAQSAGLLWLTRISARGSFLGDLLGPSVLIGLGLGIAFVQLTAAAAPIAATARPAGRADAAELVELTGDLETVGAYDFGGRLTSAMTAHPKEDPETGELHFFASSPFLIHHVASPDGQVLQSQEVPGAGAALKHDFVITEHHVVFLEGSVTFDPGEHSGIPYAWSDVQQARIGVMPRRNGGASRVRWFDILPGFGMHFANAYEDAQGRIVIEGPAVGRDGWQRSWNWWVGAPDRGAEPNSGSRTRRWTVDLTAGRVAEEQIDDLTVEFPTINEAYTGREHRYQYALSFPDDRGVGNHTLVKYDRRTGKRQLLPVGNGQLPSEAVFVPAAGATDEDAGYLLTVVSDLNADASRMLVLDASDLSLPPVATVHLPRRVPAMIHGSWIPDTAAG
ncbi:MFS transporter [Streptomyces sp. NBC_00259]|uniref:MFS transporter n=1 Tax=Streptomyces sp. NBC_00259 TaxID=2903643 RepID=UPI002E280541|nr:MFS transporter [Streptomyces sp. NBC_00259]